GLLMVVAGAMLVPPAAAVGAGMVLVSGGAAYLLSRPDEDRGRAITEEFNRRRIELPSPVMPGNVTRGSLFFRVTPSPQKLVLEYEVRGHPHHISVDLAPLISLHRKHPPPASPE